MIPSPVPTHDHPLSFSLATYRVFHQFTDLGWVDFGVLLSADSAWADGTLAEVAEQLGKMVEHPKSKSMQPKSTS